MSVVLPDTTIARPEIEALVEDGLTALDAYDTFARNQVDHIVKKACVATCRSRTRLKAGSVAAARTGGSAISSADVQRRSK